MSAGLGDIPAVYAYRNHLLFRGATTFLNNVGGGLQVVQGIVQVEGEVQFIKNFALHGAGIKLFNNAEVC